MITVIGLGTEKGDVGARALQAMKRADKVVLRTGRLPSAQSVSEAGIAFETLDPLYEKCRSYDTFTDAAVREIKRAAKGVNLCYCVDGGVTEDRIAGILLSDSDAEAIEGAPKSAQAAVRAGLSLSYQAVSAYELSRGKLALPLVVYDLSDRELAGDVKLALAEKFGDEAPACFVSEKGAKKIPLYEADRQDTYGERTALVLYEQPLLTRKRFDLDDLMEILRRLRAPDGCPWDRAQSHGSIRINAIEEAYELVDAIDCGDPDKMREESGDVIMQAAFHTLLEEERANFTMTDVLSEVCEKLITRHTHVFGQDRASDDKSALTVWEKNKMTEKGQKTFSDAVNDVPQCFPALLRAQKICKRMGKGGWNFNRFEAHEKKLGEELAELRAAYEAGDRAGIAEELGDVLMVAAHIGRFVGADCEQALLDAVKKNVARYNAWEKLVLADGKDVNALTEDEWSDYYRRAKENVRAD